METCICNRLSERRNFSREARHRPNDRSFVVLPRPRMLLSRRKRCERRKSLKTVSKTIMNPSTFPTITLSCSETLLPQVRP